MNSMFFAYRAVLFKFKSVRIILLVLVGVIIATLALGAFQSNSVSHN